MYVHMYPSLSILSRFTLFSTFWTIVARNAWTCGREFNLSWRDVNLKSSITTPFKMINHPVNHANMIKCDCDYKYHKSYNINKKIYSRKYNYIILYQMCGWCNAMHLLFISKDSSQKKIHYIKITI